MMTEYRIKLSYCTGNSLCSENETSYLDLTWQNIDVAKENLLRIKEHYEMYKNVNKFGRTLTKDQIFLKNK